MKRLDGQYTLDGREIWLDDKGAMVLKNPSQLWQIIFMHDLEPAVRLVEGDENEATTLLLRVRHIYDDPEARMVPFHPSNRDNDQIEEDYRQATEGECDDCGRNDGTHNLEVEH